MAFDRYDPRYTRRDEPVRWSDEDRFSRRERGWRDERGNPDERGFFERAGDEISSWFGDEDAERRRHEDRMRDERDAGYGRDRGFGPERSFGRDFDRGRNWRHEMWDSRDRDDDRFRDRGRDYRPLTGDYGRTEYDSGQSFAAGGRSGGSFGSRDRGREFDPHYRNWRDRQMNELDRDYDDYRRENQSRFESEFGSWRERRQQKRGLLGNIHEHMEVVGNDDEHVGTVDKIAGDRVILTKSDPESGGVHHSLSCSDIDRIEGDRVILDCSAEQARNRWRDESRSRALFEREDQGEMGPRMLESSFEGTYRR
jgi:hypothetical protein